MTALAIFDSNPDPLTTSSVIDAYLRYLEGRLASGNFSPDNFINTRRSLESFRAFRGDCDIGRLRQYDLTEWITAHPGWKRKSTKSNAIAAVVGCFAWAEEEQIIGRSPYRRPRALRHEETRVRRPALEEEYQALLRGGTNALRHALFFLWHTGARTCEMREVTWDDLRLDAETPHILLWKHKTARQTGKPRIIALDGPTVRLLASLPHVNEHVFVNNHGGPWDRHTFARHLRRVAKRIGLDEGIEDRVTGYCMRHAFTCQAIQAGGTEKEVADLLGHSDTDMVVKVYGRHLRESAAYLAKLRKKLG